MTLNNSKCSERWATGMCASVNRAAPSKSSPLIVLLLLGATVGCSRGGPQVAPVHGHVTLDGRPLANADITFQPDSTQRASIGRSNAEGRYELAYKRGQPGAIVGEHTVRIEVSSELVKNPPPIPARYAAASELHPEVKRGDNELNFDLKSDPK